MSPIAYDSTEPINSMITSSITNSMADHASAINSMMLPSTFLNFSESNSNYKEAMIHRLIDSPLYPLQLMITGVRSSKDDSARLRTFSDYAAALAYVAGNTDMAREIVLRNNPKLSSPFLKNIAESLSIGISPDTFKELLRESTAKAAAFLANA